MIRNTHWDHGAELAGHFRDDGTAQFAEQMEAFHDPANAQMNANWGTTNTT